MTGRTLATTCRRGSGRAAVVVAIVASLVAGALGVADANAGPTAVPLRSQYETSTRSVSRDVGISVMLPDGHDLWLFGDTLTLKRVGSHWTAGAFIDGGTAVEATPKRGLVPRGEEYPKASGPTRLLPVPNDVYLPDGSGRRCTKQTAAYPARWITGAAVLPSNRSQVLITYAESCIQHASGSTTITTEGWGFVLYNWRTRRIADGPHDVFAPSTSGSAINSAQIFVTPVFDNGRLTLFSSQCHVPEATCTVGLVWYVTMPATVAAMRSAASYQLNLLPLGPPSTWSPLMVSVSRAPAGWRLIETTSIWGTYKLFSASSATGPWQLVRSATLPGCPTHTGICWSIQGHPELSTTTQLAISYSKPDAGPGGHIVVSAVPT